MIALLALVSLIGLSSGQSYGTGKVLPKYIPIELIADPLLEELHSTLDNLEVRETTQLSKLDTLIDEANLNTEFANRFNEVILPNYEFHQKQQNQRLDELENRIAEIEALRARTQDLQNAAAAINDQVNNQVYPARKQIMYDLDHLRNIHLEFNADLEETQQRADAVNDRIDALFEKAWDNTRELLVLDNARKQLTQEVNAQAVAAVDTVALIPNTVNATATLDFPTALLGAPQFAQNPLIGFHVVKEHTYETAYPSLYFGVFSSTDNTEINTTATDMGSGGWTAYAVAARVANIYFSTQQLSLK